MNVIGFLYEDQYIELTIHGNQDSLATDLARAIRASSRFDKVTLTSDVPKQVKF